MPAIKEQTSSLTVITVAYLSETMIQTPILDLSFGCLRESCDSQSVLLVEWHITCGRAQSQKATCSLLFCLNFTLSKYHANYHSLSTQTVG